MTESQEKSFSAMNFFERVEYTDERLGGQYDRIKSPQELLKFKKQKIYIVVSPFGDEQNNGTCFILEWDVGRVVDQYGNKVTPQLKIDPFAKERYICYGHTNSDCGISLKDFNIVPNNYNNNCIFTNLSAAEAYIMYRKLRYEEDASIANINNKYPNFFKIDKVARMFKRTESVENKENQ